MTRTYWGLFIVPRPSIAEVNMMRILRFYDFDAGALNTIQHNVSRIDNRGEARSNPSQTLCECRGAAEVSRLPS